MTHSWEPLSLRPDLLRALRAGVALALPLFVSHALGWQRDGVFVAMAAQAIALPDLRGAYGMRLMILALTTFIAAGSAMLGVCVGGSLLSSVLAMGLVALMGGCWRFLSADYGPGISVSSALLFLLGLSHPGPADTAWHLGGLILLGGLATTLLSMALWPFRPQHPFRYAVAEVWVAVSDLAEKMRPPLGQSGPSVATTVPQAQRDLRATLDRTYVIIAAAQARRKSAFLESLEKVRVQAVQLAMQLTAMHTACEGMEGTREYLRVAPVLDSSLKSLSDAARSVAVTLITHRLENFSLTKVRFSRSRDLLHVLQGQMPRDGEGTEWEHLQASCQALIAALETVEKALNPVVDQQPASSVSYPRVPPDIGGHSLRSLTAWVNPSPGPDMVLLRYSLRMAVLTMMAVACYKGFQIPNGYWIAFTIVVVLQPDYGSTRNKAVERVGGTLAGVLLGSALLWIHMPVWALDVCAVSMAVCFAYFLRRRYGVAVFFVTLMLVLITETMVPVHLEFTVTRLLSNLLGAAVALAAAIVFWPVSEDRRFRSLLAAALLSNKAYANAIFEDLQGKEVDVLMTKREAENADRFLAASLQRLLAEPARADVGEAALATYNQRITRALTALAAHASAWPERSLLHGHFTPFFHSLCRSMDALAAGVEGQEGGAAKAGISSSVTKLSAELDELQSQRSALEGPLRITLTYLAKSVAEIQAMALSLNQAKDRPRAVRDAPV